MREFDRAYDAVSGGIQRSFYTPLNPLIAAQVLRDCSQRKQATAAERSACRSLMRQAALNWRRGLPQAA